MSGLVRKLMTAVTLPGLVALGACSTDPALSDENSTANLADVANVQSDSVETAPIEPLATPRADWLVGSWVLAAKGGEDGRTVCGDFNRPALLRLNGDTAQVATFDANGIHRVRYYTAAGADERSWVNREKWSAADGFVTLTSLPVPGLPETEPTSDKLPIVRMSANAMRLGTERHVRCVGSVDDIYGE